MDFAGSGQASTIVREKLDSGNAYINDCIIDELDWFDNESKAETQLREFWEETGVQPYIILRDYDPSLTTDDAKEEWTMDYYDANFEREDIFLYVYFAEQDTENDVGYMTYAGGTQTTSVMDSEAVDIFWGYIDRYWYDDISTDDLFANAFNKTANSIMKVSTTSNDVMKWVVIVVGGIVVVAIINSIVKKNNQRKKEKAAEDQKILETPLEQIVDDELTKKYLD